MCVCVCVCVCVCIFRVLHDSLFDYKKDMDLAGICVELGGFIVTIINILKKCQTVFQNDCTIFPYHQNDG